MFLELMAIRLQDNFTAVARPSFMTPKQLLEAFQIRD